MQGTLITVLCLITNGNLKLKLFEAAIGGEQSALNHFSNLFKNLLNRTDLHYKCEFRMAEAFEAGSSTLPNWGTRWVLAVLTAPNDIDTDAYVNKEVQRRKGFSIRHCPAGYAVITILTTCCVLNMHSAGTQHTEEPVL